MQNRRIIGIPAICGIILAVLLVSALGVGARDRHVYDKSELRMYISAMQDSLMAGDSLTVADSLAIADSLAAMDSVAIVDSLPGRDSSQMKDRKNPGMNRPPKGQRPDDHEARNRMERDPRNRNMNPNDPNYKAMMKRDSAMRADDSLARLDSIRLANPIDSSDIKDSLRYEAKKKKRLYRDSVKRTRDSIRWATPRILETTFIPDSMQYKRLITWNVGQMTNDYKPLETDSTYNYWYSEYPFFHEDVDVTYLGTVGSATQNINFLKRREFDDFKAYAPYIVYSYTPETLPFYNTKSPYTELAYWGNLFAFKDKEEINVRLMVTQNITPAWNVGVLMERWSAAGTLANEQTANNSVVITSNYLGKNYVANLGYIHQNINRQENGGVQDSYHVKDTTMDAKTIPVNLSNANNKLSRNTVFLDHSYTFSLKKQAVTEEVEVVEEPHQKQRPSDMRGQRPDQRQGQRPEQRPNQRPEQTFAPEDSVSMSAVSDSTMLAADSSAIGMADPKLTFGHLAELSRFYRYYTDNIGTNDKVGRDFYNDMFYINPVQSADSSRVFMVENKIFFNLQPWSEDAVISDIFGGVGYKWKNIYGFQPDMFLTGNRNIYHNDIYAYAGVKGQFRKYLNWGADAQYSFMGDYINDMDINAHLDVSFYPFADKYEPIILSGRFNTSLKEPDWYSKHYYSNHYVWNNEDFGKTSNTEIEASLKIPKWNMEAAFGYALVDNYLYNDTLGIIRQNDGLINVMTGYLKKNFKLWIFRFDHRILFQYSSDKDVLPLPMFTFHFRYYLEFTAVKNVLDVQLGADATLNTKYYSPAYNPALGTFQLQTKELVGNNPYIDLFVNLQWKRLTVYLKFVNIGQGWPNGDIFSAYHYVRPFRIFKVGIYWPFVVG